MRKYSGAPYRLFADCIGGFLRMFFFICVRDNLVVVRVEVIIAPVRVPRDWLHHDHHHVITLVGIT